MSGFDHSHPQCSADASSSVDGSGLDPSPSPLPSTAATFTEVAAASATSAFFGSSEFKQATTDPQSPALPDADPTDESEQNRFPPLPLLNNDSECLPSHVNLSSPSGSDTPDLPSPRTRSTSLTISTTIAASAPPSGSGSRYDAQQTEADDWTVTTHREGLPSPGESEAQPFQYSSPAHRRPPTPPYSSSQVDIPDGAILNPQDIQGSAGSAAGEILQDAGPPHATPNEPLIVNEHAPTQLLDENIVQTGPSLQSTDDINMGSTYEDASGLNLLSHHEEGSVDHDFILDPPFDYFAVPYSLEGPVPSSADTASHTSDQVPQNALVESPTVGVTPFEGFEPGADELMEFDIAGFLDQLPNPMDLDNPIFNTATGPQGIPTIATGPQVIFPPHVQPIPQQWLTNHPNLTFGVFQGNGNGFLAFTATLDDESPEWPGPPFLGEYERNLSFADFCNMLSVKYRQDPVGNAKCKINPDFIEILNFHLPNELNSCDVDDCCSDYQGIPWRELDIERHKFRLLRDEKYSNYANLKPYPEPHRVPHTLPVRDNFLHFRKTYNNVDARFSHFQLRHVVCAVSKNDVFYTGESTVIRLDPQTGAMNTVIDLRKPCSGEPIKITTLASELGVIIAGGFYGEYAMKSLDSTMESKPVEGLVTTDLNGITNHVHFFKSRTTGTPMAVFSSNDEKLRVLNCYRNQIVEEFKLPWAINCSATSPDGRLRVIVGDAKEVVIQGADDGETIHQLPGHLDYGFACAWSDDGHTIATGNQDMMVRIYDARNFKREVAVLDADIAGARSLRFTPVGSGPRVLAFAEPADIVSIVDAVSWESRQRIDFFGEIAGIDFSPSGQELYIANSDRMVGGLMQFDRWKSGVLGQVAGSGDIDDDDYDDGDNDNNEGLFKEMRISRRRMRLRDVNMDYLGIL
ncbi:hypothetical protein DRE_06002 [Drechslerella stenobrocha 248]|uniref:Uncharacterized protein n=1 Tax=Drechslerella stenobrocha 248 TaxID=1043628 RepID=W7I8D7_9PEZI|nr:hypothetical protein DRE_06002 [Drechslerella stenobrocha 248]